VESSLMSLVAAGEKAQLYFGYNKVNCTWNTNAAGETPEQIVAHLAADGSFAGVGGYFLDDEPHISTCPDSPEQMLDMTNAIHAIDPNPATRPTMLVDYVQADVQAYSGTVDVIGLDWYPCRYVGGCDFTRITTEATWPAPGQRYRIVLQAFDDGYYRLPTTTELNTEFRTMKQTGAEGYIVYAWRNTCCQPDPGFY